MPRREINKLTPDMQTLYYRFESKCKDAGLDFIVTCTTRTIEEQKQLVASGKSKTMNSKHFIGKAFDIAVMKNGKVSWVFSDYAPYGVIGESIGLEWGGNWKRFKDGPHFQLKEAV